MPLSPLSILVGGTIAAIGSAYVFKKFVYDPHVAPFIEALLAERDGYYNQNRNHHARDHYHNHHNAPQGRHAVPIPVSIATTSSRQQSRTCQPGVSLRRRSTTRRDSNEFERDRPYAHDRDLADRDFGMELGSMKKKGSVDTLPVYYEPDTGEYRDGPGITEPLESAAPGAHSSGTIIPVFDAEALDGQDRLEATALRPQQRAITPIQPQPQPLTQDNAYLTAGPADRPEYAQASTAFSILSLSQSQIDSPESPTATLASMHLQRSSRVQGGEGPDVLPTSSSSVASGPTSGLEMSGMLTPGTGERERTAGREDDIISLADTEDEHDLGHGVEVLSSRAVSPQPVASSPSSPFSSEGATGMTDSQVISELGLSWVRARSPRPESAAGTLGGSPITQPISLVLPSSLTGLRHSPGSVVSLSESEGWSAGSDWDGVADEHRI